MSLAFSISTEAVRVVSSPEVSVASCELCASVDAGVFTVSLQVKERKL